MSTFADMGIMGSIGNGIVAAWDGAWALDSGDWSSIGTWATVAVAIVAAGLGLNQLQEAKKTRDEQAQPNVVMYTEPVVGNWQFLDIVIKNFGQTPAYGVTVHLDSPPKVSPDHQGAPLTDVKFPSEIPILAPQQEWRTLWDHAPSHQAVDEIPNRHSGSVRYRDSSGTNFDTPTVLDFDLLLNARQVKMKTTHDVAETLKRELKSANDGLAAVARTLEGFSNEHSGIWTYPSSAQDEREHRRREQEEDRARREELERWAQSLLPNPPQTEPGSSPENDTD